MLIMEELDQDPIAVLIFNALLLRTQAHIWHLQTTSFSEHKAFEELYKELDDINDRLAETAIGQNIFLDADMSEPVQLFSVEDSDEVIDGFMEDLMELIEGKTEPALKAIMEEILSLMHRTKYKLNVLTESAESGVDKLVSHRKLIKESH